jgi:LPXTG-site transpeptidase (sortase) family protein
VDTREGQFIYKVTDQKIVSPREVNVTAAVPFHPKRTADKRRITLTTCHPKFSAAKRLIIFGELAQRLPRANSDTPSGGT